MTTVATGAAIAPKKGLGSLYLINRNNSITSQANMDTASKGAAGGKNPRNRAL